MRSSRTEAAYKAGGRRAESGGLPFLVVSCARRLDRIIGMLAHASLPHPTVTCCLKRLDLGSDFLCLRPHEAVVLPVPIGVGKFPIDLQIPVPAAGSV
jgi:hypothetical protein